MQFATPERIQQFFDSYKHEMGEELGADAHAFIDGIRNGRVRYASTGRVFLEHLFHSAVGLADWFMSECEWIVIRAPKDTGFIASDHPFCSVPPEGWPHKFMGPGLPGALNFYPLTRRYCLIIRRGRPEVQRGSVDKKRVRIINMNIAANSERFIVGPDEDQLRVIVSRSQTETM